MSTRRSPQRLICLLPLAVAWCWNSAVNAQPPRTTSPRISSFTDGQLCTRMVDTLFENGTFAALCRLSAVAFAGFPGNTDRASLEEDCNEIEQSCLRSTSEVDQTCASAKDRRVGAGCALPVDRLDSCMNAAARELQKAADPVSCSALPAALAPNRKASPPARTLKKLPECAPLRRHCPVFYRKLFKDERSRG